MKKHTTIALVFLIVGLIVSCGGKNIAPQEGLVIYVSIQPQAYFAHRIGGKFADVHTLVEPGQSPATYEPTAQQMAGLSDADVLFSIGVPFETALIPKIENSLPDLDIVNTHKDIKRRLFESVHNHGDNDQPSEAKDPHIWLDPKLAVKISRAMFDKIVRLDPVHKDYYQKNLAALENDLTITDSELSDKLAPYKDQTLYVFHPAFGYFTDAYGLKQRAIEVEGKEPSAKELAATMEQMKADKVRVIFVQEQFSASTAAKLAAQLNATVLTVDPLAYQYIDNLRAIGTAVVDAFKKKP